MRKITFETLVLGLALVIFVVCMAYAVSYPAPPYEQNVQWADVPVAVKETIVDNGHGGHADVIKTQVSNGHAVYKVEVKTPEGGNVMLRIDETGKLLTPEDKSGAAAGEGNKNAIQPIEPTR